MRFEVSGKIRGTDTTISWADTGEGFTDPSGETDAMIATGVEVRGTATGPFYEASADALVPAFLTALFAFDDIRLVRDGEGADAARAALDAETALPAGVIS